MRRAWLAIGFFFCLCVIVLAGAWLGWYGPLLACGPERAALCVAWPAAGPALVWLGFLGFFVGLGAWHLMEWRREPLPPAVSDEG